MFCFKLQNVVNCDLKIKNRRFFYVFKVQKLKNFKFLVFKVQNLCQNPANYKQTTDRWICVAVQTNFDDKLCNILFPTSRSCVAVLWTSSKLEHESCEREKIISVFDSIWVRWDVSCCFVFLCLVFTCFDHKSRRIALSILVLWPFLAYYFPRIFITKDVFKKKTARCNQTRHANKWLELVASRHRLAKRQQQFDGRQQRSQQKQRRQRSIFNQICIEQAGE